MSTRPSLWRTLVADEGACNVRATACNVRATSKNGRHWLAGPQHSTKPHTTGTTWPVQRACNVGASCVPHTPYTPIGRDRPFGVETPRAIALPNQAPLHVAPGHRR